MSIEQDIFKKGNVNIDKLLKYGFAPSGSEYIYSKNIMEDSLKIDVTVWQDGQVRGNVYDLDTKEEYTNFRIKYNAGAFAGVVRENFEELLQDIRAKCFDDKYFIFDQSNEISNLIKEKYWDLPAFLWEKNPGFGVFRNKNSQKWYGVIMNLDRSKLDGGTGEVEVINLKLSKEEVNLLLQADGFYPAYHMNKKSWITILLDGSISTPYIMSLIEESYSATDTRKRK